MKGIASQGDVERIENRGFPSDLPRSTYEMIKRGASINPNAPALSFFLRTEDHLQPETWNYRQLLQRITQAANAFHALGAGKDTVIAFMLPNLPETHFVIWGGQAAGIVAAINPLLEPVAIAELLSAMNASILVTLAPFPGTDLWAKIQPILPQLPDLKHVVLADLSDRVRGLKRVPARLLGRREVWRMHGRAGIRGAVPSHVQVHRLTRLLNRQSADRLVSGRVIAPEDYSSFFCTGGTTGIPKIAMRRHRNEVSNAWSASQFLGEGMDGAKNVLCGLPLFHVNGVLLTGLLPFSKGAHVLLATPQGYRGPGLVSRFWEIIEYHRINFFSGVPTLYAALLQIPIGERNVKSLEYGLCGAAPMPSEVFREFQDVTGLKILEGYGLTEATCVSSCNPPLGERRLGSIGLRVPGQKMKAVILDQDGSYLRDCVVAEAGVLVIAGPNVFAGYRLAEQNKGLWIEAGEGERWLNTGDLGHRDADGYFWLTGRRKELIIRGGHNIDPAVIEDPLTRHPAVQLAAAIGRPDAHAGELPVAYVQLRPGHAASGAQLVEFLQGQIAERAALPKSVHVIGEMPLTAVGKIFKPALKQLEIEDALHEALVAAGVAVTRLQAVADARGTRIEATLDTPADKDKALAVLGRYAFPVSILPGPGTSRTDATSTTTTNQAAN
ncbi:acyl-CoA synthetase [Oleomonas cavernae]|uniref:Acyl-CoA synthetase n=1 Tax=Oleomonas cavernae TaxID=2320859 RepID=A0A418WH61_9PROT|nr:acyl-CoA synthetase [Oleomonas cavernae]RJF89302.1 acyl-CoA synthetase [Oleomonas cavernae]